jgi:hypothetical protein
MLDDGTITFTATATDTHGNEAEDTITADKDTTVPLAMMAGEEDDDDDEQLDAVAAALAAGGDDPGAIDEALAGEDEWLFV